MLKYFNFSKKNSIKKLEYILKSRKQSQDIRTESVKKILLNVRKNGDKAVIKYEKQFSRLNTKLKKIKFSKKEINRVSTKIDKNLKRSIDTAYARIRKFHLKQKFKPFRYKDNFKNELAYKYSPINNVGVYVPGGTASYPSTVLMNCIPALVAGVKNIF